MSTLYGHYDLERSITENISVESAISLSDEQVDFDELQIYQCNGALLQADKIKGIVAKYTITNHCYLTIHQKSVFSEKQYRVHLGYLDDKAKRRIIVAWDWLGASAGFALVTVAVHRHAPEWHFPYNAYVLLGILLSCTVLTVASLLPFFYKTRFRHVYHSRTGHVPIAEFMPGRPDRSQYRKFRELLESHIRQAGAKVGAAKALAGELREHRRLFEAGVLNRKEYEKAKAKIFKSHGNSGRR